jgi:SAM-dependent methyltransferase
MKILEDGYGKDEQSVEYWLLNRTKLSDLYKSERHFFVKTIMQCNEILDIGCAAGGSALFSREAKSEVLYTGIDISTDLIKAAKTHLGDLPNTEFLQFDGITIPLKDNSVDLVFSFGVFHHLNNWNSLLLDALRVSKKYVLFDVRVWHRESLLNSAVSYQKLALAGPWDGESILPYNIISFDSIGELSKKLNAQGISFKAYGYYQKPTELAFTPANEVLMLSILLEKDAASPNFEFIVDGSQDRNSLT